MKHFFHARRALALVAALLFTINAQTVSLPLPAAQATQSIKQVDLQRHLNFLASDELGGRYTFSAGNRIAARYLAAQLEAYGFRGALSNGAAGGAFLQDVPLGYRRVAIEQSGVTLSLPEGMAKKPASDAAGATASEAARVTAGGAPFGLTEDKYEFKYGDDFISESPVETEVKGELVFAGFGVSAPQHRHDDYAGLDVRGKIVVVESGLPEALKKTATTEEAKQQAARERGAAALVLLPSAEQLGIWGYLKNNGLGEQLALPPRLTSAGQEMPTLLAGAAFDKTFRLLLGAVTGKLARPVALPGSTMEIRLRVMMKAAPSAQNVVAILDGTDARLRDEFIVVSAHYDHLESEGAEIYNGADDDGSGTAAVLEIAEALSLHRPRRSVLIVLHTGEELGLFGSEYNTAYAPVVPLNKIVANLNIDMIGRSRAADNRDERDRELTDKNSLYIIGSDKLSTELHRLNEQTNRETARLRFDYLYNDERHPEQFYYRSDHYNYARHGIPVIFYFTGVHRDYHQPTDDIAKLDFDKMERITRLIFAVAYRVANLDHRLKVDKKGY